MNSVERSAGPDPIRRHVHALRVLAGGLLVGSPGCAIHVKPPIHPADPVHVYIADYGYHSSLLLPRPDGKTAEFTYGQWDWYALNKDQWYRAAPTLLVPAQGALGTRDLSPPQTEESIRSRIHVKELHGFAVERSDVERLLAEIDAYLASVRDRVHYNAKMDLHFVPDRDRYWLFWQCNNRVATWLRKLGCKVTEGSVFADFVVEDPPG